MAKKSLTYINNAEGLREAIGKLEQQLETVEKRAYKSKFQKLIKLGSGMNPYDYEVTKSEIFAFGELYSSRSMAGRVWGRIEDEFWFGSSRPPIYIGDLATEGAINNRQPNVGSKTLQFIEDYLDCFGVRKSSTPDDWVHPDERPREDEPRDASWSIYDRKVDYDDLRAFEETHPAKQRNVAFDIMYHLPQYFRQSDELDGGQRIYIGHLAGPLTTALAGDFESFKPYENSDTQIKPGTVAFIRAYLKHIGIEPGSTPEDWFPVDTIPLEPNENEPSN